MTKKNTSSKKKLLPAAGMLALSAAMLSSATFAWFTMSREVEVQNIQMTATVPEDIQLSLGAITNAGPSANLASNTGFLTAGNVSGATAPGTDDFNWSNTADISAYYAFGKLIPASSTTGEDIYFTPDANGVGKTVKSDGKFYMAADALAAQAETTVGGSGSGKLNSTAHLYTDATDRSTTWKGTTYSKASAWNATNSDGYYIDIPVWLRTSSNSVDVAVKAYVVDVADTNATDKLAVANTATDESEKLYKAVRVAILNSDGTSNTGLIPVADGDNPAAATPNDKYSGASVINYYTRTAADNPNTNANNGGAVSAVDAQTKAATYTTPTAYSGATVATLTGGTGVKYGEAQQFVIRVWLEGEDPDCWNETAGQDWSINLQFYKVEASTSTGG